MATEMVLNGHIEVMPAVRGGKPRLAGTRITVDDVVLMHFRLANLWRKSPASTTSARCGLLGHGLLLRSPEVDRRIEEDQVFVEAFRRRIPLLCRQNCER